MLNRLAGWQYLRLLSGVYLAMFLVRVAFGILVITFGRYVASSEFVFGLVLSSGPLLELVTVIFATIFIERYGRKGVLLAGLALAAVALYGLALIGREHYVSLAVMNALHGVAAGLILVTTLAIIASVASPETRGREMGLFNFANMFGWFAGFALGSVFLDVFASDLRYTFVIAGFLATLGLVYGHFAIQEPKRHAEIDKHDPRGLLRALSNRRVLVLAAAWLVVFVFIASLTAFFSRVVFPEVPIEEGGAVTGEVAASSMSGTGLAVRLMGLGLVFMASQVVFGRLSDRYGREPMMLLGGVGFVGFMLTALVSGVIDGEPRSALENVSLLVFGVAMLAFAPSGLAALADEAARGAAGATINVYSIVLNIGFIVGPPVVGLVADAGGPQGAVAVFVGLAVVLLALVLVRIYQVRGDARPARPVSDS